MNLVAGVIDGQESEGKWMCRTAEVTVKVACKCGMIKCTKPKIEMIEPAQGAWCRSGSGRTGGW